MKTMRPGKRILALVLCIMLFASLLPGTAFAAGTAYYENGDYHFYTLAQLQTEVNKVKSTRDKLSAVYEGTGAFQITSSVTTPAKFQLYLTAEEIVIPSGVTLTLNNDWTNVGGIKRVTVNGTLVNNSSLSSDNLVFTVNGAMTNNAPIVCRTLEIKGSGSVINNSTIECANLTGKNKLTDNSGASVAVVRDATSAATVEEMIEDAAAETRSDITYRIDLLTGVTLSKSLSIPTQMTIRVGTDPNNFATLTLGGGTTIVNQGELKVVSAGSKISIQGTLVNQGLVYTAQGGKIELGGGTYQESSYGRLQVQLPYDSDDSKYYSEADSYLSGFDLSLFNHTASHGNHFYRLKTQSKENGWMKIGSDWYYIKDGKMLTNAWAKDSTGWCYLGADGKMVKNAWAKDSGGWCYLKADGHLATSQWVAYKGDWYYIDGAGHMVTGWKKVDNKQYYFKDSGVMATGWTKVSGSWYFFRSSGVMATNSWQKDSKGWCYVGADGKMLTSAWQQDSSGWCYIKSSGRIAVSEWVKVDGKWYYFNANGHMLKGWQKVNDKWYYLDKSGAMQTGWLKDGGKWYYLQDSGAMKTGWLKDNGKWYYLDSSGVMVTGSKTINGKTYTFSGSGVCQNP